MSEHILEIRHLSKAFGSHAVLKDIDFTVDKASVPAEAENQPCCAVSISWKR